MKIDKFYFKWEKEFTIEGLKLNQTVDNELIQSMNLKLYEQENEIETYIIADSAALKINVQNGKIVGFFCREEFLIEGVNILNEFYRESIIKRIENKFEYIDTQENMTGQHTLMLGALDAIFKIIIIR